MSVTADLRAQVRATYNYQCGYCGVSETLAGGELEIDHFRPRQHDGTDTLNNLVYACPACNRFKSDYWPASDSPAGLHLLHPQHDDLSHHITLSANGQLMGLTPRGWFHVQWLHLNRPQLVALRLLKRDSAELQAALAQAEVAKASLQAHIRQLETELVTLRDVIARLTNE